MTEVDTEKLKTQIEYYLSDANLKVDKFFHHKISSTKDGWIDIQNILNCNKIKILKAKEADVIKAVEDSTEVEIQVAKRQIRRKENKALPELTLRKRDAKASVKEDAKEERKEEAPELLDEKGNHILVNADFENPLIVHFKTEGVETEEFKVNWKEVETVFKAAFPKLKVVYSRADKFEGDLAISSHRLTQENSSTIDAAKLTVQEREFTFTKTIGEDLKAFWQKQGGHYQFCIQPKMRAAKKAQKIMKTSQAEEKSKKGKLSYEIAGIFYSDINKVKSKAKAILNLKKDGEKLTGNDQEFLKELLKFHEKQEAKLKDFSHFEAGVHPDYEKTRCFFVVRDDGSKEDFSISKCIVNLEKQQ